MNSTALFKLLFGQWHLDRTIFSPSGEVVARGAGSAAFSPHEKIGNTWVYGEKGEVQYGRSPPLRFRKSYFYSLKEERLSIFFDAELKELYHTIEFPNTCCGEGEHLCKNDLYSTKYRFEKLPREYSQEVTIDGPNKKYVISTRYRSTLHTSP